MEIEVCRHIDDEKLFSHNMWRELMCVGSDTNYKRVLIQTADRLPNDVLNAIRSQAVGLDELLNTIESLIILWYYMRKATTSVERIMAITTYCKCIFKDSLTNTVLLSNQFETLFNMLGNDLDGEVQSVESMFDTLRAYLDNFALLKTLPAYTKLYKFFMYALSLSIFERFGVTFDNFSYNKIESEAIKRKYHVGVDFMYTACDTILFLCERGYQCMKTGSLDPIYHSDTKYQEWYTKYALLKRQSAFLSNPDLHNINLFTYVDELNDCITKGGAIAKYSRLMADFERTAIRGALNDLEMIKATFITKRAAQKDRAAPFSPLICGGSSVAKSAMVNIIYTHLGKVFDNPIIDGSKYTRNPSETHWNGLTSAAWCIVIDDIAFLHPNAANGVDPTMLEVIAINNNMAFVPEQADLPDKGKIAVRPELFITTTNTEHLNAHAYFSCPLAVRRRFPWVIDIVPKDKYIRDECMIDGSKIPISEPGCYPDLWNIEVKRVVPASSERLRANAKLVSEQLFDNIDDFLAWLSVKAIEHREQQKRAMASNDSNKEIDICKICFRAVIKCVCDQELQSTDLITACAVAGPFMTCWCAFVLFLLKWYAKKRFLSVFFDFVGGRYFTRFLLWMTPSIVPLLFKNMGRRVQENIGVVKEFTTFISCVAIGGFLSHYLQKYYYVTPLKEDLKTAKDIIWKTYQDDSVYEKFMGDSHVQAKVLVPERLSSTRGTRPEATCEERNNVWYKNDFLVTSFDVSKTSLSQTGCSTQVICERLLRNCVQFIPHFKVGDLDVTRPTKAINISGHVYMCNNHGLPECEEFQLEIIRAVGKDGVNPNIRIKVTQSMIHRYPDRDICFIEIRALPPGSSILEYFHKDSLNGIFRGWYLKRNTDGSTDSLLVDNIRLFDNTPLPQLDLTSNMWFGVVPNPTLKGDCGSMLLANTGYGPVILGIHVLGMSDSKRVGALSTNYSFVEKSVAAFGHIIIQSGEPSLSAPSAVRVLGPLHNKSVFRYIDQGCANVYGSFQGFKVSPKSYVTQSLLAPAMIKRGYEIKHGPPVMSGWQPWRKAALPLSNPNTQIDSTILEKCKLGFIQEIIGQLSLEQLKTVQVYDDFTALNGAAGISYVDKMNRNTSMGCPWKKGKKYFLKPIPEEFNLPDPVEFTPEVMDRVDDIIKTYESGHRWMPVFCGNLKDEAKSFKHIKASKTRVFMGAPSDWSLVVRKYFLSVIRLVQNNRFIFESGPGTIAQSLEWEEIREHLTKFGLNRIIDGDYENFDKQMASLIILAAFDVLLAICEKAGYSPEDLLCCQGIAEDTAFPLMDFNGDLIEFFGGNPSGHPLTVIINGLANSLYIRYCFYILWTRNEQGDVPISSFQQFVALMTYGDDNAMGVTKRFPWFNHTSIRGVLAEIGINYTMANKEAESVPYTHIDDISFLKRTWRFDADVDAYLSPLDESSILKMLTVTVASKSVIPEIQAISTISTALREYFFYGKEIFDAKFKMLNEIVDETGLRSYVDESTFPSWHELKKQFWLNSSHVVLKRKFNRIEE